VSGRQRHLLVDTTGWLLHVVVHPANRKDPDGAQLVLAGMNDAFPGIHQLWADQGDTGTVTTWIKQTLGWEVTIV
jgi:putative transposase